MHEREPAPGHYIGLDGVEAPWPRPDEIDAHVRFAHEMRSRMVHDLIGALFSTKAKAPDAPATAEEGALSTFSERLRAPLTSIRSSAEILRDHPEISDQERGRFLTNLLEAEARLETVVSRIMRSARTEDGGSVRIDLRALEG